MASLWSETGSVGRTERSWEKSHLAKRNYDSDEIVSSDMIREQLFDGLIMTGDQQAVFDRIRSEATVGLSAGNSVVIDVTNSKQQGRLINARSMPLDLSVEYIVIDQPMREKVEAAGWRVGRDEFLSDYARIFNEQLADIPSGDGLSNVTVRDMRSHTRVPKKAIGD